MAKDSHYSADFKHEWRKHEKALYLAKTKPQMVEVPAFKFITVKAGYEAFSECVAALYSLAYGLKMNLKKMANVPAGYTDYTVYPLEGLWDINEQAKKSFTGTINKDDLVYTLMIRQPDFIDESLFNEIKALVEVKKPSPRLSSVSFETLSEGPCIQMLHLGPFEDEPLSFSQMKNFAENEGLNRISKMHREIYLTDARRVSPEKYKTVLRFQVEPKAIA
ncbi:GyrI-like domain-containing protein [Agarivorans aestuarii]|uniref:GyrI-like domain-containing protein n=1 Tax=Agarivorans aestuarii TaxID=1563703 RepID=A0ABU7FZJ2_9ALTE|nr:GyrI-like domain-containing protein [Agarivorans aestuarii]MEE1672437.1 GyrI-like domain-containing protein [Agarivorans aestuarii]